LSQFAVPSGGPYYHCIAVSQTADATGSYYVYAVKRANGVIDGGNTINGSNDEPGE